MNKNEIILRNKTFAISVIRFCYSLPKNDHNLVISRQLIRCSTSIGANYRAACRAKSSADFINKLKIVEEETDESIYFLDLLHELNEGKEKIRKLITEAEELLKIYVSSLNTAKKNQQKIKS